MAQGQNILRDIKDLEKRIRKLSTVKQPIGADIIQLISSSLVSVSSGSIAAGSSAIFTLTITPLDQILNLWDLFHSFYIDTNSNSAYLYPDGGSLSSGQKNLSLSWGYDYLNSNDETGIRVAKITIRNEDSSPHTYYLHAKWYGIKQSI